MKTITNFGFSRPMVHDSLKTWQSNVFVWVGDYLVSFSGDDGNGNSDNPTSRRHYLYIGKRESVDANTTTDLTEKLGFETYGKNFQDFLDAIEKVKTL